MGDAETFEVYQASPEQRRVLCAYAESHFTRGIMDTLIVKMTPGQLRQAHDDTRLKESEAFADDCAKIRPA